MEKGYFSAAWGDITKSPGWFSKIFRLGLLNLIPIFGQLVTYGYFFGWARDIAWNVHRPMPDRIFGNEDGNLYKRGFFILVIGFVFSLVPGVFNLVTGLVTGFSFAGLASYHTSISMGMGALLMWMVFSLAGLVLTFAVVFFYWVGAMRTSLYGTLSSGFQIGKIWAMIRYDFSGLLRIFAMSLICSCILGFALFVIIMLMVLLGTIFGVAFIQTSDQAIVFVLIMAILIVVICLVVLFVTTLIVGLVARALGYWTRQFQVNLWGGQEDPMPFELEQAKRSQQRYDAYTAQQQGFDRSQSGFAQQQPNGYAQQPGGYTQQQPGGYTQAPGGYTQQQSAGFAQEPSGFVQQHPNGYTQQSNEFVQQPQQQDRSCQGDSFQAAAAVADQQWRTVQQAESTISQASFGFQEQSTDQAQQAVIQQTSCDQAIQEPQGQVAQAPQNEVAQEAQGQVVEETQNQVTQVPQGEAAQDSLALQDEVDTISPVSQSEAAQAPQEEAVQPDSEIDSGEECDGEQRS